MDFLNCMSTISHKSSLVFKCCLLLLVLLAFRTLMLSPIPKNFPWIASYHLSNPSHNPIRINKFLEVPQIIWGLNNQKIAFARACLTARLLNRTLLLPSLTANLVYKEINLSEPIPFNKVFNFEKFNSLCTGFVQLGHYSSLSNRTSPLELQKGSGRKWTKERDLSQLQQFKEGSCDKFEVIRITGKNPFLWHDHWPVKDYAKVFRCLALVDEIEEEASKVISKIQGGENVPYIAVHMRIEIDWMIHCKKVEQRLHTSQICSSKEEITNRVAKIASGLPRPIPVYLAIADSLLKDGSILSGWEEGLIPFEKKKLGVWDVYQKHPYITQAAIDFEVCLRADVFVGNSYSTFSSLVVLQRTENWIEMGSGASCGGNLSFASYAYNILGEDGGAQRWMTDMSALSLESISYGTNNISCEVGGMS
ncbi:uncharacterized protein A4U43_C06F980 [Asparagus officinalis]|uniref:O-fucosyltransferase family protein n=1 Tax=Asparagus officinalis TaxID=4686 RepID=A0A5P1EIK4_ASPOF|nr:uncharacterized protein LOC109845100 [Asparagus officinalis]XP_020269881.1 uncharacterized protein LOC109845100 [Asparagus officinalis]XP_020269884.1 uncharacterized protein LOC109845100 [Asparagus officinalis]XP_020269885.1 uncharacterized protein LOC109845100 [Asparagus officinalis]XP_020269886.1 uncharacterized protein LOC109845100 [Asparagus officinalis]XP_020269887.1 uncharacterized protein LOC109845100 [Asparagus officinalis]XP_020269888.1 uncharacterized protein LOC109845100 [Aspara